MPFLFTSVDDHSPAVADATLEPFPGFRVVPRLTARVEGEVDVAYEPELEITFDMASVKYRPTFVGIRAEDVNGTMLRTVRVTDYVKGAARAGIFLVLAAEDEQEPLSSLFDFDRGESIFGAEFAAYLSNGGPDEFAIAHVAFSYVFAQLAAEPPAKAVQRDVRLTPRTADNWIARARSAGLLEPKTTGRDQTGQLKAWHAVMSRFDGMSTDE
ncbi:hypothetical protein I8920_03880 [Curtobacterium sp. YC1]|uniref:hypothetical protein n=1 Tax=Curtobacterium sp. YC1 TaxID=2795488 RepID=UPI0018E55E7B|nr:hypothetical protein [Curtobacterium sp. YC1]QQD76907.1 hypothetical protein I8920_03880 [Curtobacterium sp. YC1]